MIKIICQMLRKRFKQKQLFKQIFEFIDDTKYCPIHCRKTYEGWLLELASYTKASEIRHITFGELKEFCHKVIGKESSTVVRDQGELVIRKFYKFAIKHSYVRSMPQEAKDVKEVNLIPKKTPKRANFEMIKLVKEMYGEGGRMTFDEIAKILNKKFGKHYQRQHIWKWYHSPICSLLIIAQFVIL